MRILVIGASGQIGRLLIPKLIADGHQVEAMVRSVKHGHELEHMGALITIADLENKIEPAFEGIEAVIFTAGSGSKTGKDKTLTIDLWSAIKCIRICEAKGIRRFIMVSALKARNPDWGNEAMKPYLAAKHAADEILKASRLDYTILRPGRLTNDPGSGTIQAAAQLEDFAGTISRSNVAECIRICLQTPDTAGRCIELLDGDTPIAEALR